MHSPICSWKKRLFWVLKLDELIAEMRPDFDFFGKKNVYVEPKQPAENSDDQTGEAESAKTDTPEDDTPADIDLEIEEDPDDQEEASDEDESPK